MNVVVELGTVCLYISYCISDSERISLYLQIIEEEVSVCELKDQLLHLQAQVQHRRWILDTYTEPDIFFWSILCCMFNLYVYNHTNKPFQTSVRRSR